MSDAVIGPPSPQPTPPLQGQAIATGAPTVVTPPPFHVNWPANMPGVAVQLSRWMSLRHRIANCRRHLSPWVVLGSAFFGSFVSLIPAAKQDIETAHSFILTANTVACGGSALMALVLWLAYRGTARTESDSIWSAVYEMDAMARECGHDPDALPSPLGRQSLFSRARAYWNRD